MTWEPISLTDLQSYVAFGLDASSVELRAFFGRVAFTPEKWRQSPWGDQGGGFWAVAAHDSHVLWYNDIEDGFNVSAFSLWGEIPADGYWCNQDRLGDALRALAGGFSAKAGPPQSFLGM